MCKIKSHFIQGVKKGAYSELRNLHTIKLYIYIKIQALIKCTYSKQHGAFNHYIKIKFH